MQDVSVYRKSMKMLSRSSAVLSGMLATIGASMAILLFVIGPKGTLRNDMQRQIEQVTLQIMVLESRLSSMSSQITNASNPDVALLSKQVRALQSAH